MPQTYTTRTYDIIAFGDELPGILSLICAAREYYRRTNKYPRSLLMFKGDSRQGVGGHLVRGGLSYLDRSSIPLEIRRSHNLDSFGDAPAIYEEFLQRVGVVQVALDPTKASQVLREMLAEIRADILSNIEIESVIKQQNKIVGINLTKRETYLAKQFIDSTVNAELAQAAGVKKLKGFETFGLPDSELSVTLVFQTQGLSVQRLQYIEKLYLERFTNLNDIHAQQWLNQAAGNDPEIANFLREDLVDRNGNFKTMYVGKDYIDIRCKALSIAYHSFRGTPLILEKSGAILDNGNVAILSDDRLSWNAFLYDVNADQAEALARGKAKPTSQMLAEMDYVIQWFKAIGANTVTPASELYIRHVGNVTGVIDPLTGAEMLAGGVRQDEALGTFGYHFDIRGGIKGLGTRAERKRINNLLHLQQPLFNIGIQHALIRDISNLAVISPASGFEGYACSAGRIVEFNCGVGQGIGIAAAMALLSNTNLAEFSNQEMRNVLFQTGRIAKIYGQNYIAQAQELREFEYGIVA
ncbi:FAD-dependent oxidoreductase [Rivularia sp. UHCC 0363]|uniref:FAD-dependent oxidoreductase n=1 Tax=Rivularia sp. UHCC 0363 TaxID=3110244 RepID=UPI002B20B63F|nr:FAD-dependent oxidoreductase [Rivularia sp. UHCC 0363]MEA5594537.1 FAD-dependent oxidoreductase [Rivularia sp. UHCC 0363]